MTFSLDHLWSLIPDALTGIWMTIQVSVVAIAGGLIAGLLIATIRMYRIPVISQVFVGFVEMVRNTPFLAQLFLLYFGLPALGLNLPDFAAAAVALGIWTSAYASENFRAGLETPSKEVKEAGFALGMKTLQVFGLIVLPLGVRAAFPSLVNTIIEAMKHSAYLALIAFPELTYVLINDITASLRVLEGFALLLIGYVGLVLLISMSLKQVEKRLVVSRTV